MCETGRLRAVRERLPDRTRHRACAPPAGRAGRRAPPLAPAASLKRSADSSRAMRIAAFRLEAPPRRVPAMSKAVPWSGLVRTKGRPSVTFTPCSTPRYLTGIRPWSCVIATTRSNSPGWPGAWRARMKTVSGANGPLASMPCGTRRRDRRRDEALLLVAEQPALAGMRVQPGHGDARPRLAPGAQRLVGDADRLQHRIEAHQLDRAAQRHVDAHQHHAQFVVGQHHAHRRGRPPAGAARACSISVWPG